tara:strand:+ start:883 stop:1899 length:1017 start_codon:yes stop_codon:yes gene_type:complete
MLSIIIPVFNEIRYLDTFVKNIKKSFEGEKTEYIFIDDGSIDGSGEWLDNYVKKNNKENILIKIKNNSGKGNAIHRGMEICKGDYILFQDSDLELDSNDSLEMYKIIKNDENIKCIFGSRYLSGKLKRNNNFINEFIGRINSLIFNLLFFQSISDVHCGTKIITKQVKEKINLKIKDFGFEIDLSTQIAKNNFDIFEYGISYFARSVKEGKKITWIDGIKSYFYLFKTRFIDNEFSINLSIVFSLSYMSYVGSYFGMGIGNSLMILLCSLIGLFIGLHRKIITSSIIFLFIYIGSLFSNGNGKIYTVLIGFLIGIYLSKKFQQFFKNKIKNKFFNFLF